MLPGINLRINRLAEPVQPRLMLSAGQVIHTLLEFIEAGDFVASDTEDYSGDEDDGELDDGFDYSHPSDYDSDYD